MSKFSDATLEAKGGSGGGRRYDKYNGKIAVAVNKSGITLLGKANEILSMSGYAYMHVNGTEWAIQPTVKTDGYKLSKWGGDDRVQWHIVASKFIRKHNLTVNAVYVGKIEEGFLVFSRMPTDLI